MNDALLVRRSKGLGDLPSDGQCVVDRQRPAGHAVGQRRPLDQLQHQGADIACGLEPVDGADVGMVERGQDLRLALESRQTIRIFSERLWQHLQRHVPVEGRVPRPEHFSHAALTNLGGDLVGPECGSGSQHRLNQAVPGLYRPRMLRLVSVADARNYNEAILASGIC